MVPSPSGPLLLSSPAPEGTIRGARGAVTHQRLMGTKARRQVDLGHVAAERISPGLHRRCHGRGSGAVAELAGVVASPTPEGAVGLAHAAIVTAPSATLATALPSGAAPACAVVLCPRWCRRRAGRTGVLSPAPEGAVGLARAAVTPNAELITAESDLGLDESPDTWTAWARSVVVPSPSWPALFLPQQ